MGTTEGPVTKGDVHHAVGAHDDVRLLQWLLHELRRHQAELAARQPPVPGIPLHAAAAAIWRKKVAWGWEPRLQELIGTLGIG